LPQCTSQCSLFQWHRPRSSRCSRVTPLTCEPNLRTHLDPAGLLRDQSLAPRKPTGNSMFSQIRTRAMIHETTGIMPCRGGGDGLLHIAFSEGLNGNPTQIALMDIVAKRPSPLTHERAPITPCDVSAPAALRSPPDHLRSHDFGFVLAM
jgi:hypothetical protein